MASNSRNRYWVYKVHRIRNQVEFSSTFMTSKSARVAVLQGICTSARDTSMMMMMMMMPMKMPMPTNRSEYTECKYGGPLGRFGSSCAKARLVRPQEFCFDRASWRLSRSIWLPSSCCVPDRHQKGDFTLADTTFTFPRSLRIHAILRGDRKHFTAKRQVCSLHLL